MTVLDQYQEAIAHITMAVEEHAAAHTRAQQAAEASDKPLDSGAECDDDALEPLEQAEGDIPAHWIFGSRRKAEGNAMEVNSRDFGEYKADGDKAYKTFDTKVRHVVADVLPGSRDAVHDHDFRLMVRFNHNFRARPEH